MVVELVLTTEVALMPSNLTVKVAFPGVNPIPVIVTVVEPAVLPELGFTLVTVCESVNSTSACNPLVCPSAAALSNSPTQSSSHTCQVVTKFPLASAITSHGSWSSPIGSPSW